MCAIVVTVSKLQLLQRFTGIVCQIKFAGLDIVTCYWWCSKTKPINGIIPLTDFYFQDVVGARVIGKGADRKNEKEDAYPRRPTVFLRVLSRIL